MADEDLIPPLPPYEAAWQAVSWLATCLLVAMIGARAPDDRLFARGMRRPVFALARFARPGAAGAAAALCGGAAALVYRRGGWHAQSAPLALVLVTLGVDAAWAWLFDNALWLRVGVLLKVVVCVLTLVTLALCARVAGATAALLVPVLLYELHALFEALMVWWFNRAAVPDEMASMLDDEAALSEAARSSAVLDALSDAPTQPRTKPSAD